ncbi:MAG: PD-(D/E)XK nuclease family protein [Phycisphaerae bacterium]
MGVRLVTGRAGSGKTHRCQSGILHELSRNLTDGPRLIYLVPEQATLQMERSLVAASESRILGRCEVLSFRRLASRIFNESTGTAPLPLSPNGRRMALRYLIGRHAAALREFGAVAGRSGFIAEVAAGMVELFQEAIGVEQLEVCAKAADDLGDLAASRLHDMALLYRAYLDYLGDARTDPEAVLDLARSRLGAASWLKDCRIWIDGFAGLTRQQMRMIADLARVASHVDIALLMDPDRNEASDSDSPPDVLSLFARTERTWRDLRNTLIETGVSIESPVGLIDRDGSRFSDAPFLARLERDLFTVPPRVGDDSEDDSNQSHAFEEGVPVRLVKARDRRAEVAAAITTIVDLLTRPDDPLRARDIAIIVRDLASYHDLISAGLKARDIPFFIDRRRPTFHHPLVRAVRALVGLTGPGRFESSIIQLLKSGLSGLPDETADAIENYCIAYGLSRPVAWESTWTRPVVPGREPRSDDDASNQALLAVETARRELRDRLGDWWPTGDRDDSQTCRQWSEHLVAVLERLGIADTLARWSETADTRGDLDEAAEHTRVWEDFVGLLDEMVAALGEEPMTPDQFREVLESGLSEFTLGLVPATLNQVLVGSIERSRHPPVRAVFLLGFADGQFPARPTEDTIFGDSERAFLEKQNARLGRSRQEHLFDERLLAYVAVTRSSECLWISLPESDADGHKLSPSPYWPSLRAALPGVSVETAATCGPDSVSSSADLAAGLASNLRDWAMDRIDDETAVPWRALYDWSLAVTSDTIRAAVSHALSAEVPSPEATLSKTAAAALWPKPHRASVSRLESFAQCPFRHFAQYGLDLSERPKHEISPMHMGSLYHEILERFVNEMVTEGTRLTEWKPEQIHDRLMALCEQIIPSYTDQLNLDAGDGKKVFRRGRRELLLAVEGQRATLGRSPLKPGMVEKQFGDGRNDALPAFELASSNDTTVFIRGKIDRVDLLSEGDRTFAVVLDYKRKKREKLRLDRVYHGLSLQLLAYLLVIRDHGGGGDDTQIIPAGAFYLPLIAGHIKVKHPAEAEEEKFRPFKDFMPRGIVDFDWIDTLDPTLVRGPSDIFSVTRRSDGKISNFNTSDAVGSDALPALLEHVRQKMTELAGDWIGGDIEVRPYRIGKETACTFCPYRSVCRFEYVSGQVRRLAPMNRTQVIDALMVNPEADNG